MVPTYPPSRSIDARKEPRVSVSWRARLTLPTGQIHEARVRDISESGLGIVVHEIVPVQQMLALSVSMPDVEDMTKAYMVNARIRPLFVVLQGHDYRLGAEWHELPEAARTLLKAWIRRIQHGL